MFDQHLHNDFRGIPEGIVVVLHPREANLIHRTPIRAVRRGQKFFIVDDPEWGGSALYDTGDVSTFCEGWQRAEPKGQLE